jgi:hypothetical protein
MSGIFRGVPGLFRAIPASFRHIPGSFRPRSGIFRVCSGGKWLMCRVIPDLGGDFFWSRGKWMRKKGSRGRSPSQKNALIGCEKSERDSNEFVLKCT